MPKSNDKIGPYTLISKLGRGAFGVVWLAEKRGLITTRFALKLPNEEEVDLAAVEKEASVWLHAGGHPNVLPIIEADIYDEQVVIVSEYAPEGSLSKWLERHNGKAPSTESAVEMTLGILAGLEHLHKRGIIHRDLKPDNILLQNDTPRLADFGIARILRSTSKSTVATGTPAYMPPEAFDGKRSERTDIWSVGVIFYQLLSGRPPFPQTEFTSLVGAILTREPEGLSDSIQPPIRKVVERAIQKNPNERYESASEMRKALRHAAQIQVPAIAHKSKTEVLPPYADLKSTSVEGIPVRPKEDISSTVAASSVSTASTTASSIETTAPDNYPAASIPSARSPRMSKRLIRVIGGVIALLLIALLTYVGFHWSQRRMAPLEDNSPVNTVRGELVFSRPHYNSFTTQGSLSDDDMSAVANLSVKYVDGIAPIEGVRAVTPVLRYFSSSGKDFEVIDGVDWPSYSAMHGANILAGRAFVAGDSKVVLISQEKANRDRLKVGDTTRLLGDTFFTVIGISKPDYGAQIVVQLAELQELLDAPNRCSFILIKCRNAHEKVQVGKRIEAALPGNKLQFTDDVFISNKSAAGSQIQSESPAESEVDKERFNNALALFRRERYRAARQEWTLADPEQKDAQTQFYIAYSFYREGWGHVYSDSELLRQGLETVNRVITLAPNGTFEVDDPDLQMHTAAALKAEIEQGLKQQVGNINPALLFGKRK